MVSQSLSPLWDSIPTHKFEGEVVEGVMESVWQSKNCLRYVDRKWREIKGGASREMDHTPSGTFSLQAPPPLFRPRL